MKIVAALAVLSLSTPAFAQTGGKDWRPVMRVKPGTEVRVTTLDGKVMPGHLGRAEQERIVLVITGGLPADARRALLDFASTVPGYIGRIPRFTYGKLAVDESAVSYDGARIGDTAHVIKEFKRDDIREIARPSPPSLVGAAAGLAAGAVAGFWSARYFVLQPCSRNCTGRDLAFTGSLVGLPVAGAVIGAKAGQRAGWDVVYRRR